MDQLIKQLKALRAKNPVLAVIVMTAVFLFALPVVSRVSTLDLSLYVAVPIAFSTSIIINGYALLDDSYCPRTPLPVPVIFTTLLVIAFGCGAPLLYIASGGVEKGSILYVKIYLWCLGGLGVLWYLTVITYAMIGIVSQVKRNRAGK